MRDDSGSGIQLVWTTISAQMHVSKILTFHIMQFTQLLPERIPARRIVNDANSLDSSGHALRT